MADERHDRIADVLRRKLEEIRARDGELGVAPRAVPRPVARPSALSVPAPLRGRRFFEPEAWDPDAGALRDRWIEAYRGRSAADALGAVPEGRPDLLVVAERAACPVPRLDLAQARDALARALWLLPGVRDATAERLRLEGFAGLHGLRDHPRHGRDARRLCRLIDTGDAGLLMDHVGFRGGRGHLAALLAAAWLDPADLLFLDIETMGLFGGSPVVLVGLARLDGDEVAVRQWVAASPEAEAAMVREVGAEMDRSPGLVTFNGRTFDVPYLRARAAFYGRPLLADPVHFDLLGFSRRAWKGTVTDCRLDTLAREVLGMHRDEDVPGSLVPLFYRDFLEAPDERAGLLAAIAVHNRHDMVQMARLYGRLLDRASAAARVEDLLAGAPDAPAAGGA